MFAIPITHAEEEPQICGEPTVVTLVAGQYIDAGTVTVANDADNLYVTFSTIGEWQLEETHVHVAATVEEIPQKNGNPQPGKFDYKRTYTLDPAVTTDTYVIPYSATAGDSLVVAAHASVVKYYDGEIVDQETGWGDGPDFDGKNWAMYIEYTWQSCEPPPPPPPSGSETAFAFLPGSETCFLDLGFNRWGWTNNLLTEGQYVFNIYAGAGQCDISKGTYVGILTVDYSGGVATIEYHINSPYYMTEAHVYVGDDILPTNNGTYTVAPGQYPVVDDDLANVLTATYQFTGLSGDIYVVAHATVGGFPSD